MTVVKETSSVERKEEVPGDAKSSWFRGKWSRGSSSSAATLDSERAQELFRKSMQSFALYEDAPQVLDQNLTTNHNTTLSEAATNTTDNSTVEGIKEDNADDEAAAADEDDGQTSASADVDFSTNATISSDRPDLPSVSLSSTQPPLEPSTSAN